MWKVLSSLAWRIARDFSSRSSESQGTWQDIQIPSYSAVGEKTTWCSPHTNSWGIDLAINNPLSFWSQFCQPLNDDYGKRDLTSKKQKNSGHQSPLALDRSKNDLWNSIPIHTAAVYACISSLKIRIHSFRKDLYHDHKHHKILLRKQETTVVILIAEIQSASNCFFNLSQLWRDCYVAFLTPLEPWTFQGVTERIQVSILAPTM